MFHAMTLMQTPLLIFVRDLHPYVPGLCVVVCHEIDDTYDASELDLDTEGHAGFIDDTSVFELVQASIFSITVPRCRSRCDGQDFFLLHGTKFLFETH